MRFFLDNNLSHHLANALNQLSSREGHSVVSLAEYFGNDNRGLPDEVWLPELAGQGEWIVVSGDYDIYKNPQRRQVWKEARLTTFFLANNWTNQLFWDQAWWLTRWWPGIVEIAGRVERGSGFLVPAQPHGKMKTLA